MHNHVGPTMAPPGGHTLTMPQTVNMIDFISEFCGTGNLWKRMFHSHMILLRMEENIRESKHKRHSASLKVRR